MGEALRFVLIVWCYWGPLCLKQRWTMLTSNNLYTVNAIIECVWPSCIRIWVALHLGYTVSWRISWKRNGWYDDTCHKTMSKYIWCAVRYFTVLFLYWGVFSFNIIGSVPNHWAGLLYRNIEVDMKLMWLSILICQVFHLLNKPKQWCFVL